MEEELNNTTYVQDINKTLAATFFWMFLGVISTAIIASITYYTGAIIEVASAWILICIVQVVLALVMGLQINKLPVGVTTFLFFLYSMLTGLTFSFIFAAFELTTIAYALFATAGFYGVLAYIGYRTEMDLTNFGRVLFITLIIGLVITLINIFVGSEMIDIILDWVILAVFAGLTIYDMNKVKNMAAAGMQADRVAIYGAFQLYIDFINIFIRLLQLFGSRRD